MNDYIRAKKVIFSHQKESDIAILNNDNELTKKILNEIKSKKVIYTKRYLPKINSIYIKNGWIKYRNKNRDSIVIPLKDIKIPGRHNLENVLSAVAVAKVIGVNNLIIRNTIKKFKGIPDRLELVRVWKGIKFYNDTTATAPDATIVGLKSFDEKMVLIAGGFDKNLQYKKLAKAIKSNTYYTVLIKGTASIKISKEFRKIKYSQYSFVGNMDQAVDLALKKRPNDCRVILLSPGAASFGVFVNEFDRGEKFKQKVKNLK